jgi:hypothetical protein
VRNQNLFKVWVVVDLNPHPLKAEGVAPGRHRERGKQWRNNLYASTHGQTTPSSIVATSDDLLGSCVPDSR